MYQEYKDLVFVIGIILTFVSTMYVLFKEKDLGAAIFCMALFFGCFLVVPIAILGVISEKMEKNDMTQTYSKPISETEQVFKSINERNTFANLEPLRSSLYIPDSWYDSRGMIKDNIKINVFGEKRLVLSFISVDKKTCMYLVKMAHMYNGVIEDEECGPNNVVNISFYARS